MASLDHIYETAIKYRGVKEVPGPKSNPTIVGWIKKFGRNLKSVVARNSDSTAWCAIFVSKVLAECGYKPTYHALASSYITWGKPSRPVKGAVIVVKRRRKGADKGTGSRAGYHVFFLERLGKHFIKGTGGNQGNAVSTRWFAREAWQIVAIRLPEEA